MENFSKRGSALIVEVKRRLNFQVGVYTIKHQNLMVINLIAPTIKGICVLLNLLDLLSNA